MSRPAVFFDRDNTLIVADGYLGDPAEVRLVRGAAAAVARARAMGFAVVVFSNQSGVGRGRFTEDDVEAVNARLDELLTDEDESAVIDRHEFCPFHPDATVERYRQESDLRKPSPGMLLRAADALDLDLYNSWVIGDAPRDVEAGYRARCRTILVQDPELHPSPAAAAEMRFSPDATVRSLPAAIDVIEAALREESQEDVSHEHVEAAVPVAADEAETGDEGMTHALATAADDETTGAATPHESADVLDDMGEERTSSRSDALGLESPGDGGAAAEEVGADDSEPEDDDLHEGEEASPQETVMPHEPNGASPDHGGRVADAGAAAPHDPREHGTSGGGVSVIAVASEGGPARGDAAHPGRAAAPVSGFSESPALFAGAAAGAVPAVDARSSASPAARLEPSAAVQPLPVEPEPPSGPLLDDRGPALPPQDARTADRLPPPHTAPVVDVARLDRLEKIAGDILLELRQRNRHAAAPADFSVSKLLAGVVQALALAALILSYFYRDHHDTFTDCLMVGLMLQTLTISLLLMGRDGGK